MAWAVAALALAAANGYLLVDAVRDLVAGPSFAGVLRLVVEAVFAVVVTLFAWRRSRTPPPRGAAGAEPAGR